MFKWLIVFEDYYAFMNFGPHVSRSTVSEAGAVSIFTTLLFLCLQWRQVAQELEGVVRIGAINCQEDWSLCQHQGIHGYPSLVLYPSVCHAISPMVLFPCRQCACGPPHKGVIKYLYRKWGRDFACVNATQLIENVAQAFTETCQVVISGCDEKEIFSLSLGQAVA